MLLGMPASVPETILVLGSSSVFQQFLLLI